MGATKAVTSATLADWFARSLQQVLQPGARVCVGLSGGLDSVVLLHLLVGLRDSLNIHLSAVHVHHGLSRYADDWRDFCVALCQRWNVPCFVQPVMVPRDSGEGVEAAARTARYQIFTNIETDYLVLAHHRDDQAETLLLQLLRGAGVKGLAGMPVLRSLAAGRSFLLRPLLDVERAVLLAWATEHRLQWVEDDSNTDVHYARNFLRHRILPLIAEHDPAWRTTLARSARHLADAAILLDELAAQDGKGAWQENRLQCERLAELSPARARNLLRYFLAQQQLTMPSEAQLAQIVQQLLQARRDAMVNIRLGKTSLRRFAGQVWVVDEATMLDESARKNSVPVSLCLDGIRSGTQEIVFSLPLLSGTLHVRTATGKGLLPAQNLTIRFRHGGERFRPDCHRPQRTLKYLWQTTALPPWQREQWPLVYCGEALVCIPGVGVACGWQAQDGESGWLLEWLPAC